MIKKLYPYLKFLQQEGLYDTLRRFLSETIGFFYQDKEMTFLKRTFYGCNASEIKSNDEVSVREFFPKDILQIESFMYKDSKELAEWFKRGLRCFVAEYKGRFAGYIWFTYKEEYVPEIHYWFRMPAGCVYLVNGRVLKKYRGKAVFTAMLNYLCNVMDNEKISCAYVAALSKNSISIRGLENSGFKQYKHVRFVKILNRERLKEIEMDCNHAER